MADTNTYTLLESYPSGEQIVKPSDYFPIVYEYALTLTVALAFIMIVIGGIQYTSSFANPSAKADANKRIWGAIGGLVLALMSYLILKTIDPALVNPSILNKP